jgi:RNA polymerase sigma-70 factor (ECF subfamily)
MASSLAWTLDPDLPRTPWRVAAGPAPAAEMPLTSLSEAELVAAAIDGRAGAFDLIVERHRRPVYQICYRFMNNHEDASDLAQEVFIKAYRGLRHFRGGSALGTWLHRIAVNTCLNRLALKAPQVEPLDARPHIDTRSESASERLLRNERAERVRAAVARLPRKQRAALILRTYHDLSHQEVAEILGTSVGAAKANVFHALQNLKKLLGEEV